MDNDLATTYTLIHAFLTKQLHTKAAQAVKRAAKEVVILKDGIELEGPQLNEIIKQWKSDSQKKDSSDSDSEDSSSDSDSTSSSSSSTPSAKKAKSNGKKEKPSRSTSSSSSSTSSSSDDSDSDSAGHAQEATVVKNVKKLTVPTKKSPLAKDPSPSSPSSSSSSSSTSGSDSDDESSDVGSSKTKKKKNSINEKHANTKGANAQHDSSQTLSSPNSPSDDSSSDSDSSAQSILKNKATSIKAVVTKKVVDPKKDSSDSSGSSSSSSSSSSDDSEPKRGAKKFRARTESKKTSSDSLGSSLRSGSHSNASLAENKLVLVQTNDEDMEQHQPTKKRRTGIDGNAVVTATNASLSSLGRNRKAPVNDRFKRVDPDKVEPIADNRYVAKIAPQNDYGKRAHEDLIVTRGAGFRKEKNKKKKGSYRGGEITMESHSFKFT